MGILRGLSALAILTAIFAIPLETVASEKPFDTGNVVKALANEIRTRYIFPDRADKAAEALTAALSGGQFSTAENPGALATALDSFLATQLHDKHLHVRYAPQPPAESHAPAKPIAERFREADLRVAHIDNRGVRSVAQLPGNVGYLRISGFPDGAMMDQSLASAMTLLHDTDALIVDVRGNHGGDPQSVALFESYFFEPWRAMHFNDVVTRVGSAFDTRQYWSQAVPLDLYYANDVYVLTSSSTISAGEGFSYEMQAEKRATIVGQVTEGAANPEHEFDLGYGFTVSLPLSRALNPVTKGNWEGIGVHPDVSTSAETALQTAYTMALTRLIQRHAGDERALEQALLQAQKDPLSILIR